VVHRRPRAKSSGAPGDQRGGGSV